MSNQDKDKNLDDYLTGNSELSSLYQQTIKSDTDLNTPSIDLDNSILAAAKREVNSKPKKNYSPFSNNYFIPLSTAASIFVVIAMVSFFPVQQKIDFKSETIKSDLSDKGFAVGKAMPEQEAIIESKQKRKVAALKPKTTLDRQQAESVLVKDQKQILAKRLKSKKENAMVHSEITNKSQLKQREAIVKNQPAKLAVKADKFEKLNSIEEQIVMNDDVVMQSLDSTEFRSEPSTPTINIELIYDKHRWHNLTAIEWRSRIKEIYRLRGRQQAEEIINLYNTKFPKLKLTIQDIISDVTK